MTFPFTHLLNGDFSGNGPWHTGSAVGQYWNFDFTSSFVIDGFKLFSSNLTNLRVDNIGYFNFEGSANNSTWVPLTTGFIWCDITSPDGTNLEAQTSDADLNETFNPVAIQTKLFTNNNTYRYYRFIGISGNWNSSPYFNEVCFKIR